MIFKNIVLASSFVSMQLIKQSTHSNIFKSVLGCKGPASTWGLHVVLGLLQNMKIVIVKLY